MSLVTRLTWAVTRTVSAVAVGAAKVAKARRASPSTTVLTQYLVDQQSLWSVAEILDALWLHELGDFTESAKLVNAFGRDDRIAACRNTRVRALIGRNGAKFEIVPSEKGDQRRSGTLCSRVATLWETCFSEDVLSRVLRDVIDLGVSVSRVHWEWFGSDTPGVWPGEWRPRLEPWDMRWIRWDAMRSVYVAQTRQGLVDVTPGTGEWLIVEPSGQCAWMAGAVRALAMAFFFRSMTWKDWARYCEKHGVPILAIDEPPNEANAKPVDGKNAKETFFNQLRRLGREGVLRLPKKTADGKGGFDARFIEPRTLSWPSFEAFLRRLDTCIAVFLLGQNLSTEVSGGSLAAAVSQNRVRLDYLAADAEALSSAFRNQVLNFWGRFNIEGWDDALTPWPKWHTEEPEDLKARSIVLMNVATGIGQLKKASSPVDERGVLEQYSIPMLSPEAFALAQAATPTPVIVSGTKVVA